ncbi:MAG: GTP-binding protein [Bacteroidales bacterium]|nr:GTP-binding protein [Bacteroidales bacterium]MBN2697788.1 GTP-binding protein [Bacteroidales bacterium]
MIPLIIIAGWLGSGKTTLLQNLLNEVGRNFRIAVIQNEFAPSGVDSRQLEGGTTPFRLLEINNGSVFCVCQLPNFLKALKHLALEYQPDYIFLESSGLADPINIAEIMQSDEIAGLVGLRTIITLIDGKNFFRTVKVLPRFRHQVMVADHLIINKQDITPEKEIEKIRDTVSEWNPFSAITITSFCRIDLVRILGSHETDMKRLQALMGIKSGGQPSIHVSVLKNHNSIQPDHCQKFVKDLSGECSRLKGFVKLTDGTAMAVQTIYEEVNLKVVPGYNGPTELIIFSDTLRARELNERFKLYV